MKEQAAALFRSLQDQICAALEGLDGEGRFITDSWVRPDVGGGEGGGGRTRVLRGSVLEQAGVNFSEVHGTLPPDMSERLTTVPGNAKFYATGISLIVHPFSPMVPTTHANFRYLEVDNLKWFGGGADLTPYYLYEEDAVHFHKTQKEVCDRFSPALYPKFKRQCDEYFYLPHRQEVRGVGGLFFDYLGKGEPERLEESFQLVKALGEAFLPSYLPIVERRKDESWTEEQKQFQLLRRGRYVEFNLIYDKGTQFGLKTNGRTESILVSMPPNVSWQYQYEPLEGSREAALIEVLKNPREWV